MTSFLCEYGVSRDDSKCQDPKDPADQLACNRELIDLKEKEKKLEDFKEVGTGSLRRRRTQIDSCSNENRLVDLQAKVSWVEDKSGQGKLLKEKNLPIIKNKSCKRKISR